MPEMDGFAFDREAERRHLMGADPVMAAIVQAVGPFGMELRGEPFGALIRSIMHQQLAGAAARTIEGRVLALFGDAIPFRRSWRRRTRRRCGRRASPGRSWRRCWTWRRRRWTARWY